MSIPTPAAIAAAHARIAPHVHRTPVMESAAFGLPLSFKFEHVQVTGSFKARGAFNTLLSRPVPPGGVVAASGGNHGAAVAHAATVLGHPAHIFVPEYAGPAKIALIRATGARLTVVPGVYADAAAAAEAEAARTGAMQIHPYDAETTIEGQGTLFREWDEQGLAADTVLIAVGGGGLIAGAMAWWGGRRRVVAVEPVLAPTLHEALIHGPDHAVKVGGIAANALGASRIGRAGVVLVSDDAIAQAQVALWQHLRQYVEPAGATALAAVLSSAYVPAEGERVAVLLCGANPALGPFPA
jgi:threonine dehydratase